MTPEQSDLIADEVLKGRTKASESSFLWTYLFGKMTLPHKWIFTNLLRNEYDRFEHLTSFLLLNDNQVKEVPPKGRLQSLRNTSQVSCTSRTSMPVITF